MNENILKVWRFDHVLNAPMQNGVTANKVFSIMPIFLFLQNVFICEIKMSENHQSRETTSLSNTLDGLQMFTFLRWVLLSRLVRRGHGEV